MDTETLDKLYLEWSQFTAARNSRELEALRLLEAINAGVKLNGPVKAEIRRAIVALSP